jgi:hypothetical protein
MLGLLEDELLDDELLAEEDGGGDQRLAGRLAARTGVVHLTGAELELEEVELEELLELELALELTLRLSVMGGGDPGGVWGDPGGVLGWGKRPRVMLAMVVVCIASIMAQTSESLASRLVSFSRCISASSTTQLR